MVIHMSKYTTQLRWPIEQHLFNLGLPQEEENWKECYKLLGLNDYPLWDETYREHLNTKIIRHYYMREIGVETMGYFRLMMKRTMHEIMPYYNQLYESEDLITEPMYSKNMTHSEKWTRDEVINNDVGHDETTVTDTDTTDERITWANTDRDVDVESNSTSDNVSHSTLNETVTDKNIFSDTPMDTLGSGEIENGTYATNATFDTQHTDSTTDSTSNTKDWSKSHTDDVTTFNEKVNEKGTVDTTVNNQYTTDNDTVGDYDGTKWYNDKGYENGQAELLLKYRETFLNIDMMVIEELENLFFGLW